MWQRIGKGGTRYWGKRAAGFILTDGESVLLLQRSDKGDMAGFWTIPGGKVEDGETFLGGAQRETKEEAGQMPNCTRLGTFDHQDGRFIFKSFLCKVVTKFDAKLSDEHTAAKWFPIEDIGNTRIHPGLKAIWPAVLRTIKEKVGHSKGDLDEAVIHKNVMVNNEYKAWEMQRYLEAWSTPPPKPAPPPPTPIFGPPIISPELRKFAEYVAQELELPSPLSSDPKAEKALLNILLRCTPPPVGSTHGGMLKIDWFETVIDSIAKHHLSKSGGKLDATDPAIRQANNPMQLLRTLRTYMPNDKFNPQAGLEGARGQHGREHDEHFSSRSDTYDMNRNVPSSPTPTPTPGGGLLDILDKLPKDIFMNARFAKADAIIVHIVQSIIHALSLSDTFDLKDVPALKTRLGLPARP